LIERLLFGFEEFILFNVFKVADIAFAFLCLQTLDALLLAAFEKFSARPAKNIIVPASVRYLPQNNLPETPGASGT
jgi:hypothetical protein